ncbi:MAG: exodeoxyribonuclease V subunit alpha [Proteobacteria bacterium]|nr:exodeoxyribonuclease V subunit alpha [Pseudomonadota bacterium]
MASETVSRIAGQLYGAGMLNAIDLKFSHFLSRLSGDRKSEEAYLSYLLLSHTVLTEKHICLDLEAVSEKHITDLFPDAGNTADRDMFSYQTPTLSAWIEALHLSPVVGKPGEYKPLILSGDKRLYLNRYYEYEKTLAASIKKRIERGRIPVDSGKLKHGLNRFFPNPRTSPDWQKVASFAALTRYFSVISGGPGTGKTYTITNIMAMLLEQNPDVKISVCAPTGKAAARLQESIKAVKQLMDYPPGICQKIPEHASTIHRLLGVLKKSPYFKHHKDNPLVTDVLIVDEASMVSLSLLSKLFDALSERSVVVLVGDKNQLASVEAGAVFADICDASEIDRFSSEFAVDFQSVSGESMNIADPAETPLILSDCVVELKYSYRFEKIPAIGNLSSHVNKGDTERAMDLFQNDPSRSLVHRNLPSAADLEGMLAASVSDIFQDVFSSRSIKDAMGCFERFRILCSQRHGDFGVVSINQMVEKILYHRKYIDPGKRFYKGRPILIIQNDYSLKLYNGDVGMIWEDENKMMKVFFQDQENNFRIISPARLPAHETVFAMTIHKSQGSEFDHVLMILPDSSLKLLSRELVYTGITRARRKIELWANRSVLDRAFCTRVERWSGLGDYFLGLPGMKR